MSDYMGRDSCLGRREGVFVKRLRRPGIDTFKEAVGLAALILRDYRRGYGYDDRAGCGRIRFTRELAEKKLRYIIPLSTRHGASGRVLDRIKRLVGYAVRHKRIPGKYKDYAREAISGYEKIEDELEEVFTKQGKKKTLSKGGKVSRKSKVTRKWRYNKKIGKWVLIECVENRKPPCRIIKVSSRKGG